MTLSPNTFFIRQIGVRALVLICYRSDVATLNSYNLGFYKVIELYQQPDYKMDILYIEISLLQKNA